MQLYCIQARKAWMGQWCSITHRLNMPTIMLMCRTQL